MKRERIKSITYISICVAIMAVISQLYIPLGFVPLTLQAFAVALFGYFSRWKRGLIFVFVYILLGLVGAPVFAGFQGGLGVLLGYTGGFIFGYIPFVLLCGINGKAFARVANGTVGLLLCHLVGVLQYMLISGLDIGKAFVVSSLPYLIKDIPLVVCAYFVSSVLDKRLKNAV